MPLKKLMNKNIIYNTMLTFKEYIENNKYINLVTEEYCNIIAENYLISESFQSSLLKKLSNRINDAEKENNARKKQQRERGYTWDTEYTSFASILGPIDYKRSSYSETERVRGIKWDEIKDEDFKKYKGYDKDLEKLMKAVYSGKKKAVFIITNDNDDIIFFIKGFFHKKSDGRQDAKLITYSFKSKWGNNGVSKVETDAYKYRTRDLKVNEILELINDWNVYALEITDSLINEYDVLVANRKESKKGIINYDKESLQKLLDKQKSRYRVLVEEIKAKKLMSDPKALFDEIKNVNKEVVDFYEQVMSSSENVDKFYDLGQLLTYTSYAYETYYKYVRSLHDSDKAIKRAVDKGASNPEEWGSYERKSAESKINDVKEYLERIKKQLAEYKSKL